MALAWGQDFTIVPEGYFNTERPYPIVNPRKNVSL